MSGSLPKLNIEASKPNEHIKNHLNWAFYYLFLLIVMSNLGTINDMFKDKKFVDT